VDAVMGDIVNLAIQHCHGPQRYFSK